MKKNKSVISKFLTNTYIKNLLLIVATFLVLIAIILFALKFYTKHNEYVSVPLLKGLQVEEAASILKSSSLKYEVIDSLFTKEGTPGAILEQTPKEQSNVKRGRTIYLTIQAKSVPMIAIPELKDFSRRQAEAQLSSLGFNNIIISEVPSEYKGVIISVEYKGQPLTPGQKIPKGAAIKLIVGAGGEEYQHNDDEGSSNIEKPFFE